MIIKSEHTLEVLRNSFRVFLGIMLIGLVVLLTVKGSKVERPLCIFFGCSSVALFIRSYFGFKNLE
jgi:hypothetical protein